MGSNFKGSIFNEQVQEGLISWAKEAKKKVQKKESSTTSLSPARFLANQQKSKFMNR